MGRKKPAFSGDNLRNLIVKSILLISQIGLTSSNNLKTETYDFIVVGGGVGGCAVAGRLAQTGIYKVLLIEAGGMPEPEWSVPALAYENFENPTSENLRVYQSVPQNNVAKGRDGVVSYITPKVLGGGSAVNGMFMVRGNTHDYSKWARDSFDNNWGYEKLLPYFKKSENYSGDFPSDQHGFDGPIQVSPSRYAPGSDVWLKAGMELGYPVADPNGPQIISFAPVEWSQRNGRRVSSYDGYIKPLIGSEQGKNLRIMLNTEVTKITFQGNRAVGVEFRSLEGSNSTGEARASKEIILSSGVVGTPVLLMKSGIGPRPFMTAAKIPVVQYLTGVGRNLQDHLVVGVPVIVKNTSGIYDAPEILNPRTWRTFERSGNGPYSSYGGVAGQAFIATPKQSTNWQSTLVNGYPDVHMVMVYGPTGFISQYKETLKQEMNPGEELVTILAMVGRPLSRGNILLDIQNITGPPLIDFRYLTNRADMQVAVDGIKMAMKIARTGAFKSVGARLPKTPYPECKHLKINTDEYIRCYLGQTATSGQHGVGTCRIGVGPTDHQAVVDRELRVMGINGLRIADASVMPTTVVGNPQASVYAIAEKAADLILNTFIPAVPPKKEDAYYALNEIRTRYTFKEPKS